MPKFNLITAEEALDRSVSFDAVIDVRSEDEYEIDRFPGAINCPVLDNRERIEVGTMYKQVSAFQANKRGAALVARNIARHIEESFADKARDWKPLIYCWRGGNRSAAMAHVLAQIGWRVNVIEGGYNAYRRSVVASLSALPNRFRWIVICGSTGSGKSRLLAQLDAAGAQVLDLECLARHRGSILGPDPNAHQPSQKAFESAIRSALASFSPERAVFVESESARIGELRLPVELLACMRSAECVVVEVPRAERVQLLLEDYAHLIRDPGELIVRLERLTELHGKATIARWADLARCGDWANLVDTLLREHYDPAYARSMQRSFARLVDARTIEISFNQGPDFAQAVRSLIAEHCVVQPREQSPA